MHSNSNIDMYKITNMDQLFAPHKKEKQSTACNKFFWYNFSDITWKTKILKYFFIDLSSF